MLPDRLKQQLTQQQQLALSLVMEDLELASLGCKKSELRLSKLLSILGRDSFVAILTLKKEDRMETTMRKLNWPLRSGRIAFGLIADFLISIQSERDTRIH